MNHPLRIGIVGGGQLGKMLTQAGKKMGFFVAVTDPTPNSPAGQVADKQIVAGYKDEKATLELAEISDVITIDAEFVNTKTLLEIEKSGKPVYPSPKTIEIIQDKLKQKQFLKKHKIPTAEFKEIPYRHSGNERSEDSRIDSGQARMTTIDDIKRIAKQFGYPFLLKARTDAYDGKGNYVVKNEQDIQNGLERLTNRALYIEKFVRFQKELAVMIARSIDGEIKLYPVVETKHIDNICDTVIAPAKISKPVEQKAQKLAIDVMRHLQGAGVFGIEMFLTMDDNVLINEIAPRVHNSGHYSIEACVTDQFEQHIRAITGLPLGETDLLPRAAVMKNILGTQQGTGFPNGLEKALAIPNVSIHLYGKIESRAQRKMGHITVVGNTVNECLKKTEEAREALII